MISMRHAGLAIAVSLLTVMPSQIRTAPAECRATGSVIHFRGSVTDFKNLLAQHSKVVVDFTATWCGPCKAMKPIFEKAAGKNSDVQFVVVDVDQCRSVAEAYGVRSMPTLILFKNGSVVSRVSGVQTEAKLQTMIRSI